MEQPSSFASARAFNVRSGNGSAFKGILSNKVLLLTVALGIGVNVGLCFSPLAAAFDIAALPAHLWGLIFGASLSVIVFGEVYKLIAKLLSRKREKPEGKRVFKRRKTA